jgi:phage gp46-like protein
MRHYSWLIDPTTGDYQVSGGNPVRDESLQFPAYVRLKTQRGSWLYAPDVDYGSDLYLIRKQTKATPALVENVSERALQPLLDDGRASEISVQHTGSARFGETLDANLTDRNGQTQSLSLSPVGL